MRLSFRWVMAVMLGLALIMAACGNDDDSSAGNGDAAASEPQATSAPEEPEPQATSAPEEPEPQATEEPDQSHVFVPLDGVPGVSDEEIGVALIGTNSNNPIGNCVLDCYQTGVQAYFDMVNSEGGLYGRQLVINQSIDDELFSNQAASLEVIAEDDALAAFTATLFASGWADLDEAGIPNYSWGIHTEAIGLQTNFPMPAAACVTCTNRFIPYLAQQAGATRVAAIGYGITENSRICANTYAESIDRYSEEIGAETVYLNNELEFGLPNGIGPQVTAMVEAGVDFVVSCIDLNGMATLAQELERQGVRDQIAMHHANGYDHVWAAELGSLLDGDLVAIQHAPLEATGVAAVADFLEWTEANGGAIGEPTMTGWINADLFVAGLKAAGPEFSREAIVEATNTGLTEYSANGLINETDWSRQHNPPTPEDRITNGYRKECIAAVRIQGGAYELLGTADAPFLCWDNSTTDWSDPELTSFS
ncbi:MAG: ABC transporter substrate-binding protein [bacterium]|nr:ABC transporter substrate-binding protein [bacterium]